MLGSAVQNVVALTDSIFLYYVSETDFAAIGFIGVFYLVIASIGFGLSKGGQIIIARRMGEKDYREAGKSFYALIYFALALAIALFLFMQFGARWFFELFVHSEEILEKSLAYLEPRSYGVFFSYIGMAIMALYTGIARTNFIIVDTIILALVNFILNYGLIYGAWGLPEMGIAGAGLASTIAEVTAFVVFVIYMTRDHSLRLLKIFRWPLPKVNLNLVGRLWSISSPSVIQSVLSIGSWFFFFGVVEHMGERPLAISNLARIVYLMLSIPCWGYSSGINTIVSNFIGMQKRHVVFPIVTKTAKMTFVTTMVISLPVLIWPRFFLYPILGKQDLSLLIESEPILQLLIPILALFSVGGVFLNGLTGTGAMARAMFIQFVCTTVYAVYVYLAVEYYHLDLIYVWLADIIYWAIALAFSYSYLHSRRWWDVGV